MIYYIRNWSTHYEKSQSRRVDAMTWVALPNKHDGLSYRRLMQQPNALTVYGAFVLIVQVASKCKVRGVLADDCAALTAEDIALKTGATEQQIQDALDMLSTDKIGWIGTLPTGTPMPLCHPDYSIDSERTPSTLRDDSEHAQRPCKRSVPTGQDRTEQDRTLQHRTGQGPPVSKSSGWESPQASVLKSPAALLDWARTEGRKAGIDPDSHESLTRVLAAASRALRVGKQPTKLFASLVRDLANGDASKISDAEIDAAKLTLRGLAEHDAGQNPIARRLADAMGNGKPST